MLLYKRKTITTSFMANIMVQNIDLKVKEVAIVVTVVLVTLQNVVQPVAKLVTIVIKRDTSSLFVEAISIASLVQDGREVKVDPGRTNMKFHHMYAHEQDSIQIVYNKGIRGNISHFCFNKIDGQNCSRVLADLTLCRAQGPKDCHMTNFENFQGLWHRFILDSGTCSNLLPLKLYKELFPHVTRQELLRSIDHRVQLLSYNKKEICQYGVCYLHVKSKNHVKLCKFYVTDSRFNPIIGFNSACHLGLLKITEPVFENWTDMQSISSSELNIDAIRKTSKDLSCDKSSKFLMFQIFLRH